jgi:hypothetical protein
VRDPQRIQKLLGKLYSVWLCNPDMRLGQLIDNLSFHTGIGIFQIEDDAWEKLLDDYLLTGKFAGTV